MIRHPRKHWEVLEKPRKKLRVLTKNTCEKKRKKALIVGDQVRQAFLCDLKTTSWRGQD
jgi:hypothetical protein